MSEKKQIVEKDEQRIVRLWSQQMVGNHGNPAAVEIKCHLTSRDIFSNRIAESRELRDIWNTFSGAQKTAFTDKYGRIALLSEVSVHVYVLRAALEFWDPTYRCFSFNGFELTPIIEEYEQMLKIPKKVRRKMYYYNKKLTGRRALSEILEKTHASDIDGIIKQKGKREGVPIDFFIRWIKQNSEDEKALTLFVLCIYGVVLFPSIEGYIDVKVVKLFAQIQHGCNPVPPILAEMFRSLDFCKVQGKGRFIGCAPLLFIWLQSHLSCPPGFLSQQVTFSKSWNSARNPIAESVARPWDLNAPKRDAWRRFFVEMTEDHLAWSADWMPIKNMIYRCGKSHVVPLLGPWGGTSYAPLLALRQMRIEQFVPTADGLRDLDFDYDEESSESKIKQVLKAWKVIRKIKKGVSNGVTTKDYKIWIEQKEKIMPTGKGKEKMEIEMTPAVVEDNKKIDKLMAELHEWKARPQEAEDDLSLVRKKLKSQYHLEKENQELDRENRRLDKLARRVNGKNVILQKQIKTKEEQITNMLENASALRQVITEISATLETKHRLITEAEEDNCTMRRTIEELQFRLDKCRHSAEKVLEKHNRLQEQYDQMIATDLYQECSELRRQCEARAFFIENALQNLRIMSRRARDFTDWGLELQDGITFTQPNAGQLLDFLRTICRELGYFSLFQ